MATGTIARVILDRAFGFIESPDVDGSVFFHRAELADDLDFDERLIERRVKFDIATGPKGPRALGVRAAE